MYKLVKQIAAVVFCSLAFTSIAYGSSIQINTFGMFDYVTAENGYSGQGHHQDFAYFYSDNRGNNFTIHFVGSFANTFTQDGTCVSPKFGSSYHYNDAHGNHFVTDPNATDAKKDFCVKRVRAFVETFLRKNDQPR